MSLNGTKMSPSDKIMCSFFKSNCYMNPQFCLDIAIKTLNLRNYCFNESLFLISDLDEFEFIEIKDFLNTAP